MYSFDEIRIYYVTYSTACVAMMETSEKAYKVQQEDFKPGFTTSACKATALSLCGTARY